MARILIQRMTWRTAAPVVLDNAMVITTAAVGVYAMTGVGIGASLTDLGFVARAAIMALAIQLCLYYADLYDGMMAKGISELMVRVLRALGATAGIMALTYLLFPGVMMGSGVAVVTLGLVTVPAIVWRIGFLWIGDRIGPSERLLILGTRPAAVSLAKDLMARRIETGVEVVGFIEPEPAVVRNILPPPGIIGTVDDIPRIVARRNVDRVVVSLEDARGRLPMNTLLEMKLSGVRFDHLASVYEEYTGKIAVENLRPSWFIFSDGFRKPRRLVVAKRLFDLLVASVGLVLGLPVLLGVGLAVRLSSHGPVLYHQRRTGQHGEAFIVHKFRTMHVDAEAGTGPSWATADDPRVTPIGAFLRRSRLDELPQLWNILVGDMSLVGPRPERPEFVSQLTREIPFYGQRHVVKPGLTGWAQVRYTYGASVEDSMEKLQYDLFYIKNMSIMLDLLVVFSTAKTVLLRRGGR
jgi:sugar transferase (PEP-CTERM system associated)